MKLTKGQMRLASAINALQLAGSQSPFLSRLVEILRDQCKPTAK